MRVDPSPASAVEVYWRPGRGFCSTLLRGLRRSGLPLRAVDIWRDPEAAALVRSLAGGNETVPTVVIGAHALVNPTVEEVLAAIADQAPHLLPTGLPCRSKRRRAGRARHAPPAGRVGQPARPDPDRPRRPGHRIAGAARPRQRLRAVGGELAGGPPGEVVACPQTRSRRLHRRPRPCAAASTSARSSPNSREGAG